MFYLDIEITKVYSCENKEQSHTKFLVGVKKKGLKSVFFDNWLPARDYINSFKDDKKVVIGFNSVSYDYLVLSFVHWFEDNYSKTNMSDYVYALNEILFKYKDLTLKSAQHKMPPNMNIFARFKKLTDIVNYILINTSLKRPFEEHFNSLNLNIQFSSFCDRLQIFLNNELYKDYHPSYYKGALLCDRVINKFCDIISIDLCDIPSLQSGTLKLRSIQLGSRLYIDNDILDFKTVQNLDELYHYNDIDLQATEFLADKVNSDIETILMSIYHFKLDNFCQASSTGVGLKHIKNILRNKNLLNEDIQNNPAKDASSTTPEFEHWAQNFDHYNKKQLQIGRIITIDLEKNKGGLHQAKENTIIEENEETLTYVADLDFGSLYPSVLAHESCPLFNLDGRNYIKSNLEQRQLLKERGDKGERAIKLLNNATYGNLKNVFHTGTKYEPKNFQYITTYVTLLAQNLLLKLLFYLNDAFKTKVGASIDIVNINTDGTFVKFKGFTKKEINEKIKTFNSLNDVSKVNITYYKSLIVKDTNSYIKETHDGNNHVVKGSAFNRPNNNSTEIREYPMIINFKDLFLEFLKVVRSKNESLNSSSTITNIPEYMEEVLKNVTPLFYVDKKISDKIYGIINRSGGVKSPCFKTENFIFTDGKAQDVHTFMCEFFIGFLLPFYSYDTKQICDSFSKGCIFSPATYGNDPNRSKNLVSELEPYKDYVVCGSLIDLMLTECFEGKPCETLTTVEKKMTPLELILSKKENVSYKTFRIKTMDIDFKKDLYRELKDECIEDLKLIIEKHPSYFIYVEYNPQKGRGIHLILRDGECARIKDIREFMDKYSHNIDHSRDFKNFTLYKTNEYKLLTPNGREDLKEYVSNLFKLSNLKPDVETSELGYSKVHSDMHFKELKDLDLSRTQLALVLLLLEKCLIRYLDSKHSWLNRLNSIAGMLYKVFEVFKFGDEKTIQNVVYHVLYYSSKFCKNTGKYINGGEILNYKYKDNETIQACKDVAKYVTKEEMSKHAYNDMFYLNLNYMSGRTKKFLIDCIRDDISLFRCLFGLIKNNYMDKSQILKEIQSLFDRKVSGGGVTNVYETHVDTIDFTKNIKDIKNKIFLSPTGAGKTYSIIQQLNEHKCLNEVDKITILYVAPTKLELVAFLNQVKNLVIGAKTFNLTSETMSDNSLLDNLDDEDEVPDVIVMTSAYLGMKIPTLLNKFIKQREGKYVVVIDELDRSLEFCQRELTVLRPVEKVASNNFTLLKKYTGYSSSESRGSCFHNGECIAKSKYTCYVDNLNSIGKEYETEYFNNKVYLNDDNVLKIFEDNTPSVNIPGFKLYNLTAEDLYSLHQVKKSFSKKYMIDTYGTIITRCDFDIKHKYLFNTGLGDSNDACGCHKVYFTYVETFMKITKRSFNNILLSATITDYIKDLLSDYRIFHYVIQNRYIDHVTTKIEYDNDYSNQKVLGKVVPFVDEDQYEIRSLNVFNKSAKAEQDLIKKEQIKNLMLYVLPHNGSKFKFATVNGVKQLPEFDVNDYIIDITSFSKSTISRAITLQSFLVEIELGNTTTCTNVPLFHYLIQDGSKTTDEVLKVFKNKYNRELVVNNAIQNIGRILRIYRVGDEINSSGRFIHIKLNKTQDKALLDVILNVVRRCGSNFNII